MSRLAVRALERIVIALPAAGYGACAAVLAGIGGLVLWSVLPLVVGWQSNAVLSGSMAPRLQVGDVVVTSGVEPGVLAPGHVILFPDQDLPGRTLLHRIVAVTPDDHLITHGDANQSADAQPVARADVAGVGRLRVPLVGLPRVWWQTGDVGPLLALATALVAASVVVASGWSSPTGHTAPAGRRAAPRQTWGHALRRRARHRTPGRAAEVPWGRGLVSAAVGLPLAVLLGTGAPSDTHAAFTGVTNSPETTLNAGTVVLTDDATGAIVNIAGLVPGDFGSACFTATYSGSVAATVRLRATTSTGTLSPYLQMTVEEGAGTGTAPSCAGFTAAGAPIYTGRLASWIAATSGVGTWAPTAGGQTRTYRVTYQLHGDNAAKNASAGFTLLLEARNS